MLERFVECFILFVLSGIAVGVLLFLGNFIRRTPVCITIVLYTLFLTVLLVNAIKVSFFEDTFSPHCQKVYRNNDLYRIKIGETKSLEEFTGQNVKISVFYMMNADTYKENKNIIYFLLYLGDDKFERIQLEKEKKDFFRIDDDIIGNDYILTSSIAVCRDSENSFSIFLLNKEE